MLSPRFLLFGALLMKFSYEVSAMNCNIGGVMYSCPTFMDDKSKMFCCKVNENIGGVEVCCDAGDFLRENTGIVIGIAVGALVILLLIILCCCCFCSCCCLAQRRLNRGTVYGPVVTPYSTTYPPLSSTYQVVGPPPSQFSNPPPYYPSASPSYNYAYQPPENPSYK
ncbi:uncharacterized protein TNIN_395992 [Trichonephila inaurata madagascariensis]|uniref:Uncharacterized protein n=2 Tax=Trichonephila inaurata madagascariensis TaxID=2747483 RepID=A0A8X6WVF1_9ARAC|nr:uncharacterized protein TNIN_395992 [Trichonephila inaurata madagascariensis]